MAAPPTNTELITQTNWTFASADIRVEALGMDLADTLDPLENLRQTSLSLSSDGTFTVTDLETGAIQTGNWELLNNQTEIQFGGLLDTQALDGLALTEEQLTDLQRFTITTLSATAWEMENENALVISLPGIPIPVQLDVIVELGLVPEN